MNDPNYESDSLDNGDIELKTIIPEASIDEIRVRFAFFKAIICLLRHPSHGDSAVAWVLVYTQFAQSSTCAFQ